MSPARFRLLLPCALLLATTAFSGVRKNQYVDDPIARMSSFAYGLEAFLAYETGPGDTAKAGYGDRVRLRVTRLEGENDRNRADMVTVEGRVGSGDLPPALDWLIAADSFFGLGDSTRVHLFASLVDNRFTRSSPDSVAWFLLKVVSIDSTHVRWASPRERDIRGAIAAFRDGREEDAVEGLRPLSKDGKLPLLARCVIAGAYELSGRCAQYAEETARIKRDGIGFSPPESVACAACRRSWSRRSSEGARFRGMELAAWWRGPHQDGEWFGGDHVFVEARIRSVTDSAATNGRPPVVVLSIQQFLRGTIDQRVVPVRWPGFMPPEMCGTGLEQKVRAWKSRPRRGPQTGGRFVLGLARSEAGEWTSDPLLRWTPAEADEDSVREKIAAWTPQVEARQKRERPAREAGRRAEAIRLAKEEDSRVRIESARLEEDRRARKRADIEDLVRRSDAVVLASAPVASPPRSPWGSYAVVTPKRWLRWNGVSDRIQIQFGTREDSLRVRWMQMPRDRLPGSAVGDSVDCVLFLLASRNESSTYDKLPLYRLADASAGILLADEPLVREVCSAVARRGPAPTEPAAACGASLSEFLALDSAAVASVELKLGSVPRNRGDRGRPSTLVLSCGTRPRTDVRWFTPCTIPDEAYSVDFVPDPSHAQISVERMRAVLAALSSVPEIGRGRVDSADPWTLSLRRVVAGEERIFQATLDEPLSRTLSRKMAGIFVEPGWARTALIGYWGFTAAITVPDWDPKPDPDAFPPAPAVDLPTGTGSIAGIVLDGASNRALYDVTVRTSEPERNIRTDPGGGFVLRALPPGRRILQFYGYGGSGFQLVDVVADSITTVVLRFGPDRPRFRALRGTVSPAELALQVDATEWTLQVSDERGRPIPNAYASLVSAKGYRAATTDTSGRVEFGSEPADDQWLFVRAAHYKTFSAPIDHGTRKSLLVRLEED